MLGWEEIVSAWDWYIIGYAFLGWFLIVLAVVVRSVWRGTPDHTRKRGYTRRLGRKNDSL